METMTEVWALRIVPCEDDSEVAKGAVGNLVRSIDETGDPILAYASEAAALRGADAHWHMYSIACKPVRLFAGRELT